MSYKQDFIEKKTSVFYSHLFFQALRCAHLSKMDTDYPSVLYALEAIIALMVVMFLSRRRENMSTCSQVPLELTAQWMSDS